MAVLCKFNDLTKGVMAAVVISVLTACGGGSGGSSTAVNAVDAPTGLTYNPSTVAVDKDQAIPELIPSNSGGAVNYYLVAPVLPTGLSLDSTTGIISGTPTQSTERTNYTVFAGNGIGGTSSTL